ncbi:MAG: zinc transporter substrate-binding protein [Synechococcaceae bacterium WB8_1A_041]|nr:zinc transporter substrate-binding protein [Synechococcaceae bacterium WB6_1B_055]NBQ18647.1 zinc transporter substrate-binding protein [Synechococcaceae bacterium WB5_2A_257]NCU75877.1 zinc transporter substrate-binding protein [Synechococcaceae bacterium WB7_1C_051]NCY13375.1 zinc transporter substrate-binding protein [Synechococcaceae bacterium WB8_1A_041]NDA74867.1 zinc transporter substrate-binding protein [Synechococcaceae bacterium WB8_3_299]NDD21563.1 zinc transporter substrate-bind
MGFISAYFRPVALLAIVLSLGACSNSTESAKPFKVLTTFMPINLFTKAVAGNCAEVQALIPPNSGPHDFQAKPADLNALRQAKVLVKNGLGMEGFLGKLIASADNKDLLVIDSSRGIATLDSPAEEAHAGHSHSSDSHSSHGEVNPHIWLDPLRAVSQVENIRDGLVKADPSCAASYRRNAATYIAKLQTLNAEITNQLNPYQGKTFVAFHDFAPYFAARYKLKADFLVDVPELNPSPADLMRVAADVKRSQLKALLSEPQEGERSFNALAKDLGVKISVFDPMETGSVQASQNPATYFKVMRSNVADLIKAFGG